MDMYCQISDPEQCVCFEWKIMFLEHLLWFVQFTFQATSIEINYLKIDNPQFVKALLCVFVSNDSCGPVDAMIFVPLGGGVSKIFLHENSGL